ncbi:MAG: NADH-quinone oxidoreductase subunit NuoE [Bryobacterales bacterium]|nr:NADH-quinone oxidoreductase subunit NuoE [Bryobacterales bacterium]
MLTPEERAEIEAEFPHYPNRKAVCIDAMKIVQKHRGWLSDDALKDIGELLGMSVADLDGVATFYNLLFRRPVGRHVIYLCDSVSCWIMDGERQCSHLKKRLGVEAGETTADGRFTLLPVVCLGACDRAPVMMIDDDTHFDLTPERIDQILERYP